MARLKEIHNSIESFLRRLSWSRVVSSKAQTCRERLHIINILMLSNINKVSDTLAFQNHYHQLNTLHQLYALVYVSLSQDFCGIQRVETILDRGWVVVSQCRRECQHCHTWRPSVAGRSGTSDPAKTSSRQESYSSKRNQNC